MTRKKNAVFEEQMDRLQKIAEILERGELSLEESLDIYKEGVDLARQCRGALDKAKHVVRIYGEEGLSDFKPADPGAAAGRE